MTTAFTNNFDIKSVGEVLGAFSIATFDYRRIILHMPVTHATAILDNFWQNITWWEMNIVPTYDRNYPNPRPFNR